MVVYFNISADVIYLGCIIKYSNMVVFMIYLIVLVRDDKKSFKFGGKFVILYVCELSFRLAMGSKFV